MIMICKPLLRYHSVESWNSKKQIMLYNFFFASYKPDWLPDFS